MNRRGFLRLMGIGAPAVAFAPFVPLPAGEAVGMDLASKVDEYYCVLVRGVAMPNEVREMHGLPQLSPAA